MLQSIRDRAHGWLAWLIIGLISIPFALWGINEYLNPSAKVIVAEVNGSEIGYNEYRSNVQQQMSRLRSQLGGDFDMSGLESNIRESVLERMVDEEVIVQSALASHMQVGDSMLASQIRSFPSFQQDGQFSQVSYEQLLSYQGLTPVLFEHQMRRALLADQLQRGVAESALYPSYAQAEQQRLQHQQRLLTYLTISAAKFADSVSVEDAEVQAYFEQHATDYYTPEKVSIEYVELTQANLAEEQGIEEDALQQRYQDQIQTFTTEPSWKASHILVQAGDGALEQAQAIRARLDAGEDFAQLATELSADPGSAKQGGDLGEFGPGMMVKPFEDAVRAMQPGEISQPVESTFGYHLIKLVESSPERVQSLDEVREKLLQDLRHEQAEGAFYNLSEQFANLAFEQPDNLDVLSQTLGLQKHSTELFSRSEPPAEGILSHPKVLAAAFSEAVLQRGANSEVLELDERHFLVLRVKQHEAAVPRPLEEVRDRIVETLKQQKTSAALNQFGEDMLKQLATAPRQALAAQHELDWSEPAWVKRQHPGYAQPSLLPEAFKLGRPQAGQALYRGQNLPNGDYVVLGVLAVADGDSAETPATEALQRQQSSVGQTQYDLFREALKAKAEVKILRQNLEPNPN